MLLIIQELKKYYSFFILIILFISCQDKKQNQFIIQGEAQGSTYAIKYISDLENVTKTQIDSLLNAFDASLSTYKPNSLISQINAGDSTIMADNLFKTVFNESFKIYKETNGIFDPTIGVLVNAYGFGPSKKGIDLSGNKIDSLLNFVGFDKVKLNANNTISKLHKETYFDFNAIAQGYSVDVVSDFLKSRGIKNAIVEIGGEIFAFGKNTLENKEWVVGIDDPLQQPEERKIIAKVNLKNLGLATSGNYRKVKTDSISGEKYVHIINPKTGLSQKGNILSATVLAKNCMIADGYATTFMIMTLDETILFLENRKDLYVFLLYVDENNNLQEYKTDNLKDIILD